MRQDNDPFSATGSTVEHTAQMQHRRESDGAAANEGRGSPATAGTSAEWLERKLRIRAQSAHADNPHWGLGAFMVKADDDVRQEVFCMHLISLFQSIFRQEGLHKLADGLRPYTIQSTAEWPRWPS